MHRLHADLSVSITELKNGPSALLVQACGSPIAVLKHYKPVAYLIPAETFEAPMDMIEDYELARVVEERLADKEQAVLVTLNHNV